MSIEYEAVIGLETHIQLNTQTKIFCSCKADSWEDIPNTNICPVCTGLPGVLPVLNERVVEKAVLLAAAMHADIQALSFFDRKNYFYPDLPKGYQISQYDQALARGGYLELPIPATVDANGEGYVRRVRINKLHIEEDAGKTKKENNQRYVDFNRCGVPLVEMVTEPDLRSADEAGQYLIRLRHLLPLEINDEWKQEILKDLPELPLERRARLMTEMQIPEYDADILTADRDLADYFEEAVKLYRGDAKKISNWLMNDVLRMRNELGISMAEMKLTPAYLASLVHLTDEGKINITTAKSLLPRIQGSGKDPQKLVEELGLAVVSDDAVIRVVCEKVVAQNPNEVQSYKDGKESLIGWFVGQVMREMHGKADPKLTQTILREELKK